MHRSRSLALAPVVLAVAILLTNPRTAATREEVTNDAGEYAFPAVDPATYTVRAEVAGFTPYENANDGVGTQRFITLDIVLSVAHWQAPASLAFGIPAFGQLREQANAMRAVQFTLRASL